MKSKAELEMALAEWIKAIELEEMLGNKLRTLIDEQLNPACREVNLTSDQRAVLVLVKQRLSNKEIANLLHRSERTIKYHVTNLLRKSGQDSRTKL